MAESSEKLPAADPQTVVRDLHGGKVCTLNMRTSPPVALEALNNVGSGLVLLVSASPSTSSSRPAASRSFRRTKTEPEPDLPGPACVPTV